MTAQGRVLKPVAVQKTKLRKVQLWCWTIAHQIRFLTRGVIVFLTLETEVVRSNFKSNPY